MSGYKRLLVALAVLLQSGGVHAALIQGHFTGIVDRAGGVVDGIDFSILAGQEVTGTFLYESAGFAQVSSQVADDPNSYSSWGLGPSVSIISFSESIGNNTWTCVGDESYLMLEVAHVADPLFPYLLRNSFGIQSAGSYTTQAASNQHCSMSLGHWNVNGIHYSSDVDDPGSVSFSEPIIQNSGDQVAIFTTAFYIFNLTSLTVEAASVPEPASWALAGLGLAGLVFSRRPGVRRGFGGSVG